MSIASAKVKILPDIPEPCHLNDHCSCELYVVDKHKLSYVSRNLNIYIFDVRTNMWQKTEYYCSPEWWDKSKIPYCSFATPSSTSTFVTCLLQNNLNGNAECRHRKLRVFSRKGTIYIFDEVSNLCTQISLRVDSNAKDRCVFTKKYVPPREGTHVLMLVANLPFHDNGETKQDETKYVCYK